MTLKEILLQYEIVVDNEYLDKYVELIENNRNTKREKFKTQSHHFIPVDYYKVKNNLKTRKEALPIANRDVNNFKVNLIYKNHILAHIYLSLCSFTNELAFSNFMSIHYMTKRLTNVELDELQELYEKSKKILSVHNCMFDENIKKYHLKRMRDSSVRESISKTMKIKYLNGELFSKEHRENISKGQKNQVYIYNDEKITRVDKEGLDKYLNSGWKLYQRRTYGQICGREPMSKLEHNFNMFASTNLKCHCIIDSERYDFSNIRDATLWWFENYHPFGEHYSESTLKRKIKASARGEEITYLPRCNAYKKHTKEDNKPIVLNYIKWFID